jgi:hypothetical protein
MRHCDLLCHLHSHQRINLDTLERYHRADLYLRSERLDHHKVTFVCTDSLRLLDEGVLKLGRPRQRM